MRARVGLCSEPASSAAAFLRPLVNSGNIKRSAKCASIRATVTTSSPAPRLDSTSPMTAAAIGPDPARRTTSTPCARTSPASLCRIPAAAPASSPASACADSPPPCNTISIKTAPTAFTAGPSPPAAARWTSCPSPPMPAAGPDSMPPPVPPMSVPVLATRWAASISRLRPATRIISTHNCNPSLPTPTAAATTRPVASSAPIARLTGAPPGRRFPGRRALPS